MMLSFFADLSRRHPISSVPICAATARRETRAAARWRQFFLDAPFRAPLRNRRSSAQSAAGTEPCVRTTQTVGQRVTPLAWVNAATAASYSVEDIPGGGMTGLAVAPIIGDILLEFVVRARRAPPLARGSSRYSHRPRPLRRYKFACFSSSELRVATTRPTRWIPILYFVSDISDTESSSPYLLLRQTAALDALVERSTRFGASLFAASRSKSAADSPALSDSRSDWRR